MKLPRDIGGEELARLLAKYGYKITRQTASHMRLSTNYKSAIISEVAVYLEIEKQALIDRLFE
jgi:predicted RNA binding protein YcfA (HicA-like mRNA interferase family)